MFNLTSILTKLFISLFYSWILCWINYSIIQTLYQSIYSLNLRDWIGSYKLLVSIFCSSSQGLARMKWRIFFCSLAESLISIASVLSRASSSMTRVPGCPTRGLCPSIDSFWSGLIYSDEMIFTFSLRPCHSNSYSRRTQEYPWVIFSCK